ncbi:Patatin phospholipase [uncultured virus]|nr:Patatin phospholipase [uncultured virus]
MSKSATKIRNLGFAGGGFYGIAQVAALKELESFRDCLDIKQVCGVSVGSLVAALYSVGYNADEMASIMFTLDFDALIKDNYFAYYSMYTSFGMYSATLLEEEIERLIRIKTNIRFCTFCQISKDLTVISTNLNYQCARFFNKNTTPNMPISKAVRMSIGYPMIITPVLFEGDLYGDGGEFLNYPITTFQNLDETLGLTFSAHDENSDGTLKNRIPITDIYDYVKAIGSTMNRATYVSQITEKHLKRSVVIHISENISSMQFNLTADQKRIIYDCGARAVHEQIGSILGLSEEEVIARIAAARPVPVTIMAIDQPDDTTSTDTPPTDAIPTDTIPTDADLVCCVKSMAREAAVVVEGRSCSALHPFGVVAIVAEATAKNSIQ